MPRALWKILRGAAKTPRDEPQEETPSGAVSGGKVKVAFARFPQRSKRRSRTQVRARRPKETLPPGDDEESTFQRTVAAPRIATAQFRSIDPEYPGGAFPSGVPVPPGEHRPGTCGQPPSGTTPGKVPALTISSRIDQARRPDSQMNEHNFHFFQLAHPPVDNFPVSFEDEIPRARGVGVQPTFSVGEFGRPVPFIGDTKFSPLGQTARQEAYRGLVSGRLDEEGFPPRPDDTGDKPGFVKGESNEGGGGAPSSIKPTISGSAGGLVDVRRPPETRPDRRGASSAECRRLPKMPSEADAYQGAKAVVARFVRAGKKEKHRSLDSEAYKSVISEIRQQNDVFRECWKRVEQRLDRLESVLSGTGVGTGVGVGVLRTGEPSMEAQEAQGWDFPRGGYAVKEAESLDVIVDLTSTDQPVVLKKLHTAQGPVDSTVSTSADRKRIVHEWATKRKAKPPNSSSGTRGEKTAPIAEPQELFTATVQSLEPLPEETQRRTQLAQTDQPARTEASQRNQRIYWHFKSLEAWSDTPKKPGQKSCSHAASLRRTAAMDHLGGPEDTGKTLRRCKSRSQRKPRVEKTPGEDGEVEIQHSPVSPRERARGDWSKMVINKSLETRGKRSKLRRWFSRWRKKGKEQKEESGDGFEQADAKISSSSGAVGTKVRTLFGSEGVSGKETGLPRRHVDELDQLLKSFESKEVFIGQTEIVGESEWEGRDRKLLPTVDAIGVQKDIRGTYVRGGGAETGSGVCEIGVRKDIRDTRVRGGGAGTKEVGNEKCSGRNDLVKDGIFWFEGEKHRHMPGLSDSKLLMAKRPVTPSIGGDILKRITVSRQGYWGEQTEGTGRLGIIEERRREELKKRLRSVVTEGKRPVSESSLKAQGNQISDSCTTSNSRNRVHAGQTGHLPSYHLFSGSPCKSKLDEDPVALLKRRIDASPLRSLFVTKHQTEVIATDPSRADLRPCDTLSPNVSGRDSLPIRKRRNRNRPKQKRDEAEDLTGEEERKELPKDEEKALKSQCKLCGTKEKNIPNTSPRMFPSELLGTCFAKRPVVPPTDVVIQAEDDQVRTTFPEVKDLDRVLTEIERNKAGEIMMDNERCMPLLPREAMCSETRQTCKKKKNSLPKRSSGKNCDVPCYETSSKHVFFPPDGRDCPDECSLRRLSSHSLEELIFKGCRSAKQVLVDRLNTEIASLGVSDDGMTHSVTHDKSSARLARKCPFKSKKPQKNRVNWDTTPIGDLSPPLETCQNDRFHADGRPHKCSHTANSAPVQLNRDDVHHLQSQRRARKNKIRSHRAAVGNTCPDGTDLIGCDLPKTCLNKASRRRLRGSVQNGPNLKTDLMEGNSDVEDVSGFISQGKRDGRLIETFMFNPTWATTICRKEDTYPNDLISRLFRSSNATDNEESRQEERHSIKIESSLKLHTHDGRTFQLDPESLENITGSKAAVGIRRKLPAPGSESPSQNKNPEMKSPFEQEEASFRRRDGYLDEENDGVGGMGSVKSQKDALNQGLVTERMKSDGTSDTSRNDYNELYTVFSEKLYFSKSDTVDLRRSNNACNDDCVHVETIKIAYPLADSLHERRPLKADRR